MFRVEWVVLFIRCFIELMFVCSENFVLIMLLRIMIELSKCLVSFFMLYFGYGVCLVLFWWLMVCSICCSICSVVFVYVSLLVGGEFGLGCDLGGILVMLWFGYG